MLELILKLIDRLIDLSKRREEVNRGIFEDFVQPAFESFEAVHADYIDSLTRYSDRLRDTSLPMNPDHPIFDDIPFDALRSTHLRTKLMNFRPEDSQEELRTFLGSIDSYLRGLSASGARIEFTDEVARRHFRHFSMSDLRDGFGEMYDRKVHDTAEYLAADPMRAALHTAFLLYDAPLDATGGMSWPDATFEWNLEKLWRLTDDRRRKLCAYAIWNATREFQLSHGRVFSSYNELRRQLLTRR